MNRYRRALSAFLRTRSLPVVPGRHPSLRNMPGSMPLVIGVAGGSGSGKTTVVRRIMDALGRHGRHRARARPLLSRPSRAAARRARGAQLRPPEFARNGPAGRRTCARCATGTRSTCRSTTSRGTRANADTDAIQPGTAIIVEGILIFADTPLRSLMDVKVFVDTDADTRFIRRLQRDVAERGRTVTSVIDQYLSHREADAPGVRRAEQALRGRDRAGRRAQPGGGRHAADAD